MVGARQRQCASDTYFNSLYYFIVCISFGVERTVQSTQDAFGSGHSLCGAKEPLCRALYTAKNYSLLCFDAIFSSFFFCILLLLFLFLHSFWLPLWLAIHRTRRKISAEPIKILRIISRVNSSPSVNSFDLTLVSSSNSGIQSMKKTK